MSDAEKEGSPSSAPLGGMEKSEQWGVVHDEDAERRSLMHRAPCVCNGEANGVQCAHYWYAFQRFYAANADAIRDGDKRRNCMLCPSFMLEFTEEEKPTRCNHYMPREAPGLVNIVKRAAARAVGLAPRAGVQPDGRKTVAWGFVPIDHRFEDFRPLSVEEIQKLRELFPDRPQRGGGKRPDQLSVSDIINGPQIGILKPGEKPSSGMSGETSSAIDGIFGGSGMFRDGNGKT